MSDLVGDARHLLSSAQEALRLRAVAALVAGRDREALVMRPRGKPVGVHQALGEAEQGAVRQAVLGHRPCDVRLGGQLWTRWLVGELIVKLCLVRLIEPGVGTYLRRWGCPSSGRTSRLSSRMQSGSQERPDSFDGIEGGCVRQQILMGNSRASVSPGVLPQASNLTARTERVSHQ